MDREKTRKEVLKDEKLREIPKGTEWAISPAYLETLTPQQLIDKIEEIRRMDNQKYRHVARKSAERAIDLAVAKTEEAMIGDWREVINGRVNDEMLGKVIFKFAEKVKEKERLKTAREIFADIAGVFECEDDGERLMSIRARWLKESGENGTPFEKEEEKAPVAGRRPRKAGTRGAGRK